MKMLLREYVEFDLERCSTDMLNESQRKATIDDGDLYLYGTFQRADAQNINGRIYPRKVLEEQVNNYQKLIDGKRAWGELDHPESAEVSLANVSHLVVEIGWKGDDVVGKILVLDTPSGNILRKIVEKGGIPGISSRGMGSVSEKNGVSYVEEDFDLACFDIVADPSTHGAFLGPTNGNSNIYVSVMEGKEFYPPREKALLEKLSKIGL